MHLFNLFIKIKNISNRKGQFRSIYRCTVFQTELLDLKPYEKVLEVGTGSGYQVAVLVGLEA